MKVLMLQDVKKIGKKGEIVEVADGYGQNFLLPRKLAEVATSGVIKSKGKEAGEERERLKRERKKAEEVAAKLAAKPVVLTLNIGDNGKAFGSISGKDVTQAIEETFQIQLAKSAVKLNKPIKSLGKFEVPVKLEHGVKAKVQVQVQQA